MLEPATAPDLPDPEKPYPGIAQSIRLCLTFLAVYIAVSIALDLLERFTNVELSKAAAMLVKQVVAWPLVLWIGLRRSRASIRDVFPLRRFPLRIIPSLILTFLGLTILSLEVASLIPMPEAFEEAFSRAFMESSKIALFLSAAVMAPAAEELFFRGLVLRGYLGQYSAWKAVWASTLVFAVFHLNPWQAITAIPLGLVLAWLVLRTGSVIPAILGHFTANSSASFVFVPILGALGYDTATLEEMEHFPAWMLAAGLVMFVVGGFLLYRQLEQKPSAPKLPV